MKITDKQIKLALRLVTLLVLLLAFVLVALTACSGSPAGSDGTAADDTCVTGICKLCPCYIIGVGLIKVSDIFPYLAAALIVALLILVVLRKVRIANIKQNAKVAKAEAKEAKKLMQQGVDPGNLSSPGGVPIKRNLDQFDKKE